MERKLFLDNNIDCKSYFIFFSDGDMLPSYTFLIYEENNKYYWFEHSWMKYKGIHEYVNKENLLRDVINKFKKDHKEISKNAKLYIYEYQKPKLHISCNDFYKYIETQKLVTIDL